jgi:hypothetical protein
MALLPFFDKEMKYATRFTIFMQLVLRLLGERLKVPHRTGISGLHNNTIARRKLVQLLLQFQQR